MEAKTTRALIIAELDGGRIRKATYSAISFARQVVSMAGGEFSILVIGPGASNAAADLVSYGAATIYATEVTSVAGYVGEHYAPTVAALAGGFDVVVATATAFGKDLMPRVAGTLAAGYAADVTAVVAHGETGERLYKRPMYAGNAFGYARITTAIHTVTVR